MFCSSVLGLVQVLTWWSSAWREQRFMQDGDGEFPSRGARRG
jgi:hypothetical protein